MEEVGVFLDPEALSTFPIAQNLICSSVVSPFECAAAALCTVVTQCGELFFFPPFSLAFPREKKDDSYCKITASIVA
jgi:hypothetical protein